jgi:hypothetical protein
LVRRRRSSWPLLLSRPLQAHSQAHAGCRWVHTQPLCSACVVCAVACHAGCRKDLSAKRQLLQRDTPSSRTFAIHCRASTVTCHM